jgi:polyvinyl alcohol dehydrogenase (cytochrome)
MALSTHAEGPVQGLGWPMIGRDVRNTRSQPFERQIGSENVARLAPKWVLTTAGDVSATPAVSGADDEDAADRSPHGGAVYVPDWGGMLWKVEAETGTVLWVRAIPDYTGVPGALSRTSPVLAYGLVYVADLNGNMMAVDAATGDLRWRTRLDPHPAAIITASPVVLGDRLYIGVSSNETAFARQTPGYQCCTFRGSLLALDAHTGRIVWQTFVLPDNGGQPGGFAGGAFVNPPAIDRVHGLVYGGAGQLYTQPDAATACLAAAPGGWSEVCFPSGAYFNSVTAFDLRTGQPQWTFRGAGADAWQLACGPLPPSVTWCPPATLFSVWDFAGAGANVFRVRLQEHGRSVVGIGQKSGVYWTLDAATGAYLWSTLVGPGSDPGGIQWGTAYDGQRIYAAIGHNTGEPYRLPSGEVLTGGSWAALDPATGHLLWQTPDPQGTPDLAALTVANGVLYGGSMAHTGDQMYALDTATGAILWRFAAGGSVVAGPAVVRGTVYWGSGYARTGGVGNNKFYAFSLDGR